MANTWQGEFPRQNLKDDGFERTSPVDALSAERLWHLRHDRQRVGVDHRLVSRRARSRRAEGLLHSGESARRAARTASYDPRQPQTRFRARCSRAARICARRIIAAAIARRRGMPSRSIPRPAMSDSAASGARRRRRSWPRSLLSIAG